VIGGDTGTRYCINGTVMNVHQLDHNGRPFAQWCFRPEGKLAFGDAERWRRTGSRISGGSEQQSPRRTNGTQHAWLGVLGRFYRHPTGSGPSSRSNLTAGAARSVPDLSPEPNPRHALPSVPKMIVIGIDSDAARCDRDHRSNNGYVVRDANG
jgi:hypothetical protein